MEPSLKQESRTSGTMYASLTYRPDIDGLRAVAVLPVIFFHAEWSLFDGGFIGVDIFFVISGFLITSILLNALHSGNFSIRHFYERRIRRILPALYTVCLFTMVMTSILFLPADMEDYGQSLVSTVFFVSNILFWQETGYFETPSSFKPLLHTWSLAVEEQFYIVFPIFLFLIYKFFRKNYALFIGLAALASFAISAWGVTSYPSATFYLAPTRAWELLLGSLLALGCLPAPSGRWLNEILSIAGAALIGYAVFFFDYATPFPGPAALPPCAGAALLIYANTNTDTVVKKALTWKPMVGIGLISYALYLWHWPLLVFGRYVASEPLSFAETTGLVTLAFVFSYLSWRYIERPFRNPAKVATYPSLAGAAGFGSVILLAMATTITLMQGMPNRFDNIERLEIFKDQYAFVEESCIDIQFDNIGNQLCRFGHSEAPATSFLIWGDSHAQSITPAVTLAAEKHQRAGTLSSESGCPPLLGVKDLRAEDSGRCPAVNSKVLESVYPGQIVFLVSRWPYYVSRSIINNEGPAWLVDEQTERISEEENLRVLERGLTRTITALQDKGAYPVLVSSPPEFFRSAPDMFFRLEEIPATPRDLVESRRAKVEAALKKVSTRHKIPHLETSSAFCNDAQCMAGEEDTLYFRDSHHLTVAGAKKVTDLFLPIFDR